MKRTCLVLGALFAVAGCGGSNNANGDGGTGTAQCPRMGTVPGDLRDVERAGEGLVSTTFGEQPRVPAWDRAGTVLSILTQVWTRQKTACPDMPAPQVKMVDDAIATLNTAIPAKDQKAAVTAANQVGLACPELFDFFHPDAPIQVIRMDAVYRQLGIDTHFGSLTAAKADFDSLSTDWTNAKSAVATRAPMCHRVGGTATVATDIETSFANVNTALQSMDKQTIENESDNGALEIDTLELLFDCPPDNAAPATGVGAACGPGTACDKGLACDTAWGTGGNGKCAPDPSNKVGTPCMTTVDCGTDSRSACNTEAGDKYPGGYCFMEPCNDIDVCPPGATCVAIGGELPGCYKACAADSDCRTSEGYVCQLFVTTAPKGFGPTNKACSFPCTRDADCQAPLKCPNPFVAGMMKPGDATYGKCTP